MTDCCPVWIVPFQPEQEWLDLNNPTTRVSNLKIIINTKYCVHTVVPAKDGPRYARNK